MDGKDIYTKGMSERILTNTANVNEGFAVSLLRYFNQVGAHESGLIGEDPNGIPNNLMPFVSKVAKGHLEKFNSKLGEKNRSLSKGTVYGPIYVENGFEGINLI